MKVIAATALALLVSVPAVAKPPPGTPLNTPEHRWWDAQRQNDGAGMSCCGQGDGHVLKAGQWRGDGTAAHPYQILVGGRWFVVPADAVTAPQGLEPNIENRWRTKVWYGVERSLSGAVTGLYIYCFEPAVGS